MIFKNICEYVYILFFVLFLILKNPGYYKSTAFKQKTTTLNNKVTKMQSK